MITKTLLRAFKRFYRDLFVRESGYVSTQDLKNGDLLSTKILDFVTDRFEECPDIESLAYFFGKLIHPQFISRQIKSTSQSKQELNLFHSCIASFSQSKLSLLSNKPCFRTLFRDFLGSEGYETFIANDSTMSKNTQLYFSKRDMLLRPLLD